MWFKNLKVYRLVSDQFEEEKFSAMQFRPCDSQQPESFGWVPAVDWDGRYVYRNNGQLLLRFRQERKILPTAVVKQATAERVKQIEERQGYRPGRKQTKEIKEQVTLELLPKAFTVQQDTFAWVDTRHGWFVIDASSDTRADALLGWLARTLAPFPVGPLHVEDSPASIMTGWLADGEPDFEAFVVDQDAELQAAGGSRATVRYMRQSVDQDDAEKLIRQGKQCTRLALTWNDHVSFVLTQDLDVRRVKPLDVPTERDGSAMNEAEKFESDFTLMTGELARMLHDLVQALGGYHEADLT